MAARAFDVVVVGAGAAGVAAARAAHEAGARVALVDAGGAGATAMTAGWVLGAEEPSAGFLRATHALREPGAYDFVATSGERVVGARSGLASLLDVRALEGAIAVVDLVAGPSWSASLVARSLGNAQAVSPEPGFVLRGETARELARALDTTGLAEALGASLRERVAGFAAVLFPPVLGLLRDDVLTALAHAVGHARVGEAGGTPGDPPSVRLGRAVERALPEAVERVRGRALVDSSAGATVRLVDDARTLDARAIVLATGGLVGGGVAFDTAFVEPCAGAPVWLSPHSDRDETRLPVPTAQRGLDPAPLFAPDERGHTQAARAGLRLDADGRVLGPDGRTVIAPWLFAAGAVLGVRARDAAQPYGLALGDAIVAGLRAGDLAARYAASHAE